ncbi:MAG: exodeoxyribonuclease VII small subunit [Rickettsiaceae bacterium]|nr:exodeoxyribonuclease VII small subunit [Rickettsiaceae bacterium]
MKDTKSIEKNYESKMNENMSFEEALSELEHIVNRLDSGGESLESSISAYERASILKNFCEKKLEEAKFTIEKVTKNSDGELKITEAKEM